MDNEAAISTIHTFLLVKQTLQNTPRSIGATGHDEVLRLLSRARVYHVPWTLWARVETDCIPWVSENVLFTPWLPGTGLATDQYGTVPDETALKILRGAEEEGEIGPMPFDTMWLGFGEGFFYGSADSAREVGHWDRRSGRSLISDMWDARFPIQVLGYLIGSPSDDGQRVYIVTSIPTRDGHSTIAGYWIYVNGSWDTSLVMTPWALHSLFGLINDHTTMVEVGDRGRLKRLLRKDRKKLGLKGKKKKGQVPDWYILNVTRSTRADIEEALTNNRKRRKGPLTYRHDRAGHTCIRISRGFGAMDEAFRDRLISRGYDIFEWGRELDSYLVAEIARRPRVVPRRPGEWMAVLIWWVGDTVVGDESLPYVPAVRVLSPDSDQQALERFKSYKRRVEDFYDFYGGPGKVEAVSNE